MTNRPLGFFQSDAIFARNLFGATPADAYYVKCDLETNPAEGIDAGQVVCEIGVAPVKSAEFVIFRLSQYSGGTSLVNE